MGGSASGGGRPVSQGARPQNMEALATRDTHPSPPCLLVPHLAACCQLPAAGMPNCSYLTPHVRPDSELPHARAYPLPQVPPARSHAAATQPPHTHLHGAVLVDQLDREAAVADHPYDHQHNEQNHRRRAADLADGAWRARGRNCGRGDKGTINTQPLGVHVDGQPQPPRAAAGLKWVVRQLTS